MGRKTEEKVQIGRRLARECFRLGLTNDEAAKIVGRTRRSWQDHTAGVTCPNAVMLNTLVKAGFDLVYIVTGRRSWTPRIVTDADGRAVLSPPVHMTDAPRISSASPDNSDAARKRER